MGTFCILSWIVKDPYSLEYFEMATDAEIRSVLRILPTLIDALADRPGPFSEYVVEQAAAQARAAMDSIA